MAKYIKGEAAVAVFEERQKALCPVGEWSRNKAYDREKFDALEEILDELRAIPAADVAPVVHGRWDDSGRYTFPSGAVAVRCTNCGCALTESEHRLYNWSYCPVCGAKMDGGTNDGA